MEEYIRVSGKTVEDAVLEASIQLGTTSDNIEWQVIEHETKGFLGLGARKAVIEARKKTEDEDFISEIFAAPSPARKEKPASDTPKKPAAQAAEKKAEKKPEKKTEKKPEKKSEKKAAARTESEDADPVSTQSDSVKQAAPAPKAPAAKASAPKEAASGKDAPAPRSTPAPKAAKETAGEAKPAEDSAEEKVRIPADPKEAQERADAFLKDLFRTMGIDARIEYSFEDNTLMADIEGDDMGILIGKRGQTLDSIQYLTSLVVNRGKSSYVRVKLDTENYRERRKATLENLARNQAFKVKKTRRPVYLEPMNPYERRIIHSALQNDPYVTTHSEGEDPARKVVITLKKRDRIEDAE